MSALKPGKGFEQSIKKEECRGGSEDLRSSCVSASRFQPRAAELRKPGVWTYRTPGRGPADFVCEGPDSKYFGRLRPALLCRSCRTSWSRSGRRQQVSGQSSFVCGHRDLKLIRFHASQNVTLLLFFSQPLKNVRNILSSEAAQEQVGGRIQPPGRVC